MSDLLTKDLRELSSEQRAYYLIGWLRATARAGRDNVTAGEQVAEVRDAIAAYEALLPAPQCSPTASKKRATGGGQ